MILVFCGDNQWGHEVRDDKEWTKIESEINFFMESVSPSLLVMLKSLFHSVVVGILHIQTTNSLGKARLRVRGYFHTKHGCGDKEQSVVNFSQWTNKFGLEPLKTKTSSSCH